MTDWWANINERGMPADKKNFAAMIRAQNDLYMVCPDGSTNAAGDNTLESIKNGKITRAEVQRSAINILEHLMQTQAMKRVLGKQTDVKIVNRPKYQDDVDLKDVETVALGNKLKIDLSKSESKMNSSFVWSLDVKTRGTYTVTLTASSDLNEVAQLPCTFFKMGIPEASFTFTGTGGKDMSITKEILCWERFQISRLFVGCNGLKLKSIEFKLKEELK